MAEEFSGFSYEIPRGNPLQEWQDYMSMRRLAALEATRDVVAPDILGNQTRFRTAPHTEISQGFQYIPKIPPQFVEGGVLGQLNSVYDPVVQPLPSRQDPNYYYGRYSEQSTQADTLNRQYKILSQMPASPDEPLFDIKQGQLEKINNLWKRVQTSSQLERELALQNQSTYNRQLQIQSTREVSPIVNKSAQLAEEAARDLEQAVKNTGTKGNIASIPKEKLHPEVQFAIEKLNKYLGDWNQKAKTFGLEGPKGGYLLEGAGMLPMVGDARRLVTGGGIGIQDGLPTIMSKSELQESQGTPWELQNAYREETPAEIAERQKQYDKENEDIRKHEELGKVLLNKIRTRKAKDAELAGNIMLSKIQGHQNWGKILGTSQE